MVPLIEMSKINKWYGSVHALIDVDFDMYEGQIVGLVGDNGAGKSTLIKILAGAIQADSGEIYSSGRKVKITSVAESRILGIETVFQEQALIECFTVAENIFATREPVKTFFTFVKIIDYDKMFEEARRGLDRLGLGVAAEKEAGFCSGGEKQGIVITRNMHFKSQLVILDEPTRGLSIAGVGAVLDYIRQLKKEGIACIYITHDLHYVYPVADRIVMLNRGAKVLDIEKKGVTLEEIEHMILKFALGVSVVQEERVHGKRRED